MVNTRATSSYINMASESSNDGPTGPNLRPRIHFNNNNINSMGVTTGKDGKHGGPNNHTNHSGVMEGGVGFTRNGSIYGAHVVISPKLRRRRPTAHHFDASSSSSDDSLSSSDDSHFEAKKRKSLAKHRSQCLPLNFKRNDVLSKGLRNDRQRAGASLADIDPMNIDNSVLFDQIGGLDSHVAALKEMILFPLIYPEVFDKYKIRPPRGVLFHGPPGTGKTLVARALCNECSTGDRKVAFFMRKGADCLSKWVGESERQLRLLFDQAYTMKPAIIFFDEIDGIAPVRSTKQDQIHSSIVSTLLALMDGLDDRGQVIIIGATNRIDAIDPALRRPGRFDREFHFPLPSMEARRQIIKIHTRDWEPPLSPQMTDILAARTPGYCGADLKALCAETALIALKRRYPQIYKSREKLLLNINEITIQLKDFNRAMRKVVPASQRSAHTISSPLCFTVKPLLSKYLTWSIDTINSIFPAAIKKLQEKSKSSTSNSTTNSTKSSPPLSSPSSEPSTSADPITNSVDCPIVNGVSNSDDSFCSISTPVDKTNCNSKDEKAESLPPQQQQQQQQPSTSPVNVVNEDAVDCFESEDEDIDESDLFDNLCNTKDVNFRSLFWRGNYRPRFLIHGPKDRGQTTHLGPAILHHFEHISHSKIDYSSIYSVSGRTPEESVSAIFIEVCKRLPHILYLPRIDQWWQALPDTLRLYLSSMIEDLEPHMPILLLATSDTSFDDLPDDIKDLFNTSRYTTRLQEMSNPTREERVSFFAPLFEQMIYREPVQIDTKARTEKLPIAPPSPPRKLTEPELRKLRKREECSLRELRLFLRECLAKLSRDKRFSIFVKPVNLEEVSDYLEIVKTPMALETMMAKIDTHKYECASQFLDDVKLIRDNALEYNPDKDSSDRLIRHRACALLDAANNLIENEMDSDFEQLCQEIHENRKKRGEVVAVYAPSNYWTLHTANSVRKFSEVTGQASSNSPKSSKNSKNSNDFNVDEDTEIESVDNGSADKGNESSSESSPKFVYHRQKRGRRTVRYVKRKKRKVSCTNRSNRNGHLNGRKISISRNNLKVENDIESKKSPSNQEIVEENGITDSLDLQNNDIQIESQPQIDSQTLSENLVKVSESNPVKSPIAFSPEPIIVNTLIIDRVQVSRIFNKVVDMTRNCSVEQLEEIYSCLFRVINKRRNDWDRTPLLKELFDEIDNFEMHQKSS